MANPDQLPLARGAIKKALKANADLAALVPPASIYGGTVPAERTFPFVRIGSIIASPFRASGLDSSSYRIMVQGFTKGTEDLLAEDAALAIGDAFKSALDDIVIPISSGMTMRTTWVQTIPMIDGDDTSAWMVTSIFNAEIAG